MNILLKLYLMMWYFYPSSKNSTLLVYFLIFAQKFIQWCVVLQWFHKNGFLHLILGPLNSLYYQTRTTKKSHQMGKLMYKKSIFVNSHIQKRTKQLFVYVSWFLLLWRRNIVFVYVLKIYIYGILSDTFTSKRY